MNVRDAVHKAREHLAGLLADEQITDLRFEEVEYDDVRHDWIVTIGFVRPRPNVSQMQLPEIIRPRDATYKVVRVKDPSGDLVSVRNRDQAA
jgi:hypothetical protein